MPAWAATTKTTTFVVQAQISADCTIAATNLNFGTLGLLAANADSTSTLTATCTNTTPYSLAMDKGTVAGSTTTGRLLGGTGAATLPFALYRDSGRTQNWGETVGTDTASGTGNGLAQTITVYGRVPIQASTPAPGTYTSTITVTVTF